MAKIFSGTNYELGGVHLTFIRDLNPCNVMNRGGWRLGPLFMESSYLFFGTRVIGSVSFSWFGLMLFQ